MAVLYDDAQTAGKAQALEKFLHGYGEQFGLLDFAAKLRKGSIFAGGWFCVFHRGYLAHDHRTWGHFYCGRGNQESQQKYCFRHTTKVDVFLIEKDNVTLQDLQEQLRAHIRSRIGRGELNGVGLARAADFPQGHLSNFLNGRRGLSLESMDRLLDTLGIGILDLLETKEIEQHVELPSKEGVERVALVSPENAALARFAPEQILETRSFNKTFLRKLRARDAEDRRDWLRFVVIRLELKGVPLLAFRSTRATLLIDRHYSSLDPYRRFQPNVYVVTVDGRCNVGYVSVAGDCLLLRTRSPLQEVEMVRIERGRSYYDYIVGRVCYVGLEV